MILYCDTSALVKLYVREEGTELVMAEAARADMIAVSRLAWVEAAAAMARRAREQPANRGALDLARGRFAAEWPHYFCIEVTQALAEQAGEYADVFALRAYDSVQLASARAVQQQSSDVLFACFDTRLVKAARMLGIQSA